MKIDAYERKKTDRKLAERTSPWTRLKHEPRTGLKHFAQKLVRRSYLGEFGELEEHDGFVSLPVSPDLHLGDVPQALVVVALETQTRLERL